MFQNSTRHIVPYIGPSAGDGPNSTQQADFQRLAESEPLGAGGITIVSISVAVAVTLCAALFAMALLYKKKKLERARREECTDANALYACTLGLFALLQSVHARVRHALHQSASALPLHLEACPGINQLIPVAEKCRTLKYDILALYCPMAFMLIAR